ncbi:hypothetical protein L484_001757 [Morus notabilis]|uniref:Uncharacterized protein n=1 Tax=Morus notabilis TaxID=981085 RepID=W9RRD7_9ROSA|nr:hypothetical protein L484_001757 [Morus notabilis]
MTQQAKCYRGLGCLTVQEQDEVVALGYSDMINAQIFKENAQALHEGSAPQGTHRCALRSWGLAESNSNAHLCH